MGKKILKWSLVLIVFAFLGLLISIPLVNDYTAKRVVQHLKSIPLPAHTEYIEAVYGADKYVGNGNGMQYLGCVLLKSTLSIDELREYYSAYADNEWECLIEEQHGQEIEVIEHGHLRFNSEVEGSEYYLLYSWGDGIEFYMEFDLRGH